MVQKCFKAEPLLFQRRGSGLGEAVPMADPFAGDPDLSLELIEIKARGGQAQGVLDLFPGVGLRTDLDLDQMCIRDRVR